MSKKPEARWFYGVDNKNDFYQYACSAYSEQVMIALHPDDMQSIAEEGVALAEYLGVKCPPHFYGMSEDPIPYMNQAVAQGLIPDYHEVTKYNAAHGTSFRNEYELIMESRKLSSDPNPELRAGKELAPSLLDAFAADAAGSGDVIVIANTAVGSEEDIEDLDAYVARAGAAFAASDEEPCPECGEVECTCDDSDADEDLDDEDED